MERVFEPVDSEWRGLGSIPASGLDWSRAQFALMAIYHWLFIPLSYRVYADSPLITEDSPRLLDVSDDPEYLVK